MLCKLLFVLCVLVPLFGICHCDNGFYTIVAPENIRPNTDYRVSVSIHNQTEPVTMKLSIEDDDDKIITKEITVLSGETKLVDLPVEDLTVNNNFKFTAEGVSGIIFKNLTLLNVESKNCSIFIQTDKAIYKPGESIKFRILVLDFKLKPVILEDINLKVFITDAEKNRIKQWKENQLNTGVFSAELPLSQQPVLGDWTITAEVGEEVKSRTLQVEEYVLPKFDVKIDSSEHFNVKDDKVRAIIRSKYTYGKLVKGRAVVTVKPTSYLAWSTRRETDTIAKTIPIDGKGTIEFDITDDLHIQPDEFKRSTTYALSVVVVEELTGRNQSASKDITIHQLRYKIKAVDLDPQFQSGIPVKVLVAVTYQDDKPVRVNDANKEIVISKIPNNKNQSEIFTKHELASNGTVLLSIPTSKKDESGFILKAKYMDEEAEIGYLFPTSNVEPTNLEIKVLTKKPTLDKEIFVEIQSIDILEQFTYQVISQGRLIYSESLYVPQRNYHVFSFLAIFDLLPTAHLIVYYFKNDDIISTKIDIDIRENLNNFIKLKLSETRVKPGDSVNIGITTKPKSYVGLLGVDQSVLLLKKNNDLTIMDAWNERELYQYQFHERNAKSSLGHSPYFYNKYWGDFQSTRMILFTNARQDVYPIIREYDKPVLFNKGGIVSHTEALSLAVYADQPGKIQRHPSQPPAAAPSHVPKVRKDFPETWLWQTINIDDCSINSTYTLVQNVPDTITSWVISAFSIDPTTGLGLTKTPRRLEVFQPFFVSINLPYSIKRGEILTIPVAIFNYMENIDADADITIHNNDGEFEFIGDNRTSSLELERTTKLSIIANHGASTSFTIRPKKIGAISIKVTATSPFAGDAIVEILHVEPEGIPKFNNKALFVDLNEASSLESLLTVDVPDDIIMDSLKIDVNCVGDLFGGTIKNLNKLIRLPAGCGEQNMLNFVPNIVILKYLKAVGQLKPDIERKAKSYTEKGYQRELTYRHNDGSFSAFGKLDKSGSTWLTAFVAKSFRQADAFIDVDESIIDDALKWLSKKQNSDGSFAEVGTVSHKAMQGGSGKGIALTAYVLTAFLESRDIETTYEPTINKAIDYIIRSLESQQDIYAMAVAAYALQLAKHPNKDNILDQLLRKATTKDESKWWNRYEVSSKTNNFKPSKTLNIEITSYGLLALLESGRFADGFPYFKWLINQRNNKGGFISTQDTVMGLQALAKFAERISIRDNNVQIMVKAENLLNDTHFDINPGNALIYQSHELPSNVHAINITANGHGFALLQLSYKYHTNKIETEPSFKLKPSILNRSNKAFLKLQVCVTYEPIKGKESRTNMVILEVTLPSGYVAESDTLINVSNSYNVKKVETKNADTIFIVYFDNFEPNKEICPVFDAFRAHKVAEQKPVSISIYDYYDSRDRATAFYSIPEYNDV